MQALAPVLVFAAMWAPMIFFALPVSAAAKCLRSGQSVSYSTEGGVKEQARQQVSCADTCSDERVTFQKHLFSATIRMDTTRPCSTKQDYDKYGCKKGQIPPKVQIVMISGESRASVTLSKCDKARLADALNQAIDSRSIAPLRRLADAFVQQEKRAPLPFGASNLSGGIEKAFGLVGVPLSDEQVRALSADPRNMAELLSAVERGDWEAAKAAAQKLRLSPEQIEALHEKAFKLALAAGPDQRPAEQFAADFPVVPEMIGASTFESGALPGGVYADLFAKLEEKYGLPRGYLAYVMKIESDGRCNLNANASSAAGCFQFIASTWRKVTGLPLELRYDINASAEAAAKLAAQNLSRLQPLIERSGINPITGIYLGHLLGAGGAAKFLEWYTYNPDLAVHNAVDWNAVRNNWSLFVDRNGNMRTLGEVTQEIERRMSGSTNFVAGTAGHVPSGYSSPFNLGYSGYSGYSNSYASPLSFPTSIGTFAPVGTPGVASPAAPVPSGTSGAISGGGSGIVLIPSQPIPAVASIVAEPKEVSRGASILVSWASVGVRSDVPCLITAQHGASGTLFEIARSNEGSKRVQTSASTAAGTTTIAIRCVALSGGMLSREALVQVK